MQEFIEPIIAESLRKALPKTANQPSTPQNIIAPPAPIAASLQAVSASSLPGVSTVMQIFGFIASLFGLHKAYEHLSAPVQESTSKPVDDGSEEDKKKV